MIERILVPVDGSALAQAAAEMAVALAAQLKASLMAVSVIQALNGSGRHALLNPMYNRMYESYLARETEKCADANTAVENAAKAQGVYFQSTVDKDRVPAHAILRAAIAYAPNLIVIGSHGYHGLKKILLGSTTQELLVRIKEIPILVYRLPQTNLRALQSAHDDDVETL
jgi:nucleotide-binding universal stress UspA family protein